MPRNPALHSIAAIQNITSEKVVSSRSYENIVPGRCQVEQFAVLCSSPTLLRDSSHIMAGQ